MIRILSLFALILPLLAPTTPSAYAGDTGYRTYARTTPCADSKFQTPRYNQLLPYRHYEDRRRYNAAPCCGEIVPTQPYLLKTVVVSRKYVPHYSYDSLGRKRCHRVLTITYKELYSDGSCRVWTVQA
jgi:hypothetical protein